MASTAERKATCQQDHGGREDKWQEVSNLGRPKTTQYGGPTWLQHSFPTIITSPHALSADRQPNDA
eukprot:CAMPEP_0115372772 /NCGR_PEP_ID=MMETSP0271-20121206/1079_1 /TAXON_ID=71861 /ORGANISM="Scrippsiella trochoidea, Strain CCMP3099" /LENGTH=65 /DNA_ID=CAMNT_0002795735 /DNA_START=216 /DNA_END=414 /DNA_ORIENTATION=-